MQHTYFSIKIINIQVNTVGTDMANHIQGHGRHQVTLLPDALDDFVTEDNPVRVVDIFVDGLQLDSLGFRELMQNERDGPDITLPPY
ncbi:Uncharacterised protein [Raoultella terrigena]|uniref:Uncharacterized protein n=1 Tax=Raoultella terrigena TaxID=577 RepID=A0A4V6J1A3_RAOTE|nr:Uncharacterised protein [Raoultella terrigena]